MQTPIDRRAVVSRHDVVVTAIDPRSPLSVGNGELGFTVDVTGLQSLPASYPVAGRGDPDAEPGTLLGTQSQWGWHSTPSREPYSWRDALVAHETSRGTVPYVDIQGDAVGMGESDDPREAWLRANPHRLDLARIGFRIDGRQLTTAEVEPGEQRLVLYTGTIETRCAIAGEQVRVVTACDPERDVLAVRVERETSSPLGIGFAFPYGSEAWHDAADWDNPERHTTTERQVGEAEWLLRRILDDTRYDVRVTAPGAELRQTDRHAWQLTWRGPVLELLVELAPSLDPEPSGLTLPDVLTRTTRHWATFWESGAAVDLSGTADPRAHELERRVVLSQFLTAIHCAGSMPPQETGLMCNSWRGKAHLEMHWWHAAHFPLWGRPELLARSLAWYRSIRPLAEEMARIQGFDGARWPKQVGPEGTETPSTIGPFLIWQQPHLIHLAELLWRATGDRSVLTEMLDDVTATADFMAFFAVRTERGYELLPPLVPAQESYQHMRDRVRNPTFELVYWHWGLAVACDWRRRLGLEVPERWREVSEGMVSPAVRKGVYAAIDVEPWTIRTDHPSMLCALGVLPQTPLVDPATMRATLDDVLGDWDWESTWGWDYPVLAMTATRLGRASDAVDLLLTETPKNTALPNGHNRQDDSLPVYLPGNGGLLAAVALMAGGWDGGPDRPAPGFPEGWVVRAEGFQPLP